MRDAKATKRRPGRPVTVRGGTKIAFLSEPRLRREMEAWQRQHGEPSLSAAARRLVRAALDAGKNEMKEEGR